MTHESNINTKLEIENVFGLTIIFYQIQKKKNHFKSIRIAKCIGGITKQQDPIFRLTKITKWWNLGMTNAKCNEFGSNGRCQV